MTLTLLALADVGWLTSKLLRVTLSSAEWVLWLLVALSVASLAVMLERAMFFRARRLQRGEEIAQRLSRGELDALRPLLDGQQALEARVLQQGLAALPQGPAVVEEAMAAAMAQERPRYERSLSFLGTLGSNAPFVGLFGTVLGIIKAFNDLGAVAIRGSAIQQTVMTGISEALVATAVGLAVAIPAVVAFNFFTRALKYRVTRAQALAHALVAAARNPRTDAGAASRPVRGVVEG
ncbi:MAG TPA: MotA/TolQ/ExbB proton channel family protein [Myxococcaceae bacterium]|nr:MotA/TolQ/ExbB proton channel family protein [Myxococcaceae bacterium]